jgi:single stranded DNA-binding protein
MNNININGNVVAFPEKVQMSNGHFLIKFSIANNDKKKKMENSEGYEKVTQFFDVVTFSKSGKIADYLWRGNSVSISGELRMDRWEYEGKKYAKVYIEAAEVLPHHWKQEKPQQEDMPF